jgi:hypothetical protein
MGTCIHHGAKEIGSSCVELDDEVTQKGWLVIT